MTAAALTPAEKIFALRMLPHLVRGAGLEAAASAVIEDDARIFTAFCERSASDYVPTADERGASARTRVGVGDVIAAELSARVYAQPAHPHHGRTNT